MDSIEFLTFQDVLDIHADQLARHGGRDGFIDRTVVESAVFQPGQMFGGQYLHEDIAEMAAAYLYHLSASQGFVDGNKRTAAASATEFLARDGYYLADCPWEELYDVTMRVATSHMDKSRAAAWFREKLAPLP
ncbi:MAG TPA: type II toxin-antitoxin system death-on-curing family toxin [Humisphaera sp.]